MTTGPREGPRPPVCRRLFADEEDDEPREIGENRENKFLEDLHRQHIESFTAKYNFDPRTETPLEGNFEWFKRRTNGEWERMPVQQGQQQERETDQAGGEQEEPPPDSDPGGSASDDNHDLDGS